jgi:protein kinase-like protein
VPQCAACAQPLPDGYAASVCPHCRSRLTDIAATATALAPDVERRAGIPPLKAGQLFASRYAIAGDLGRGGMGWVFRARDRRLDQTVALKLLHLPGVLPIAADRLASEVRLAREVAHPNVCRVYDIGSEGGVDYLSMEFIDGQTLAACLRRPGGVAPAAARDIARQICAGVAAAHERGVLHRDIKPSNVMIDRDGRVRILDFGLAVSATAATEGGRAGTPAYMAPEQVDGAPPTARSDVYALGLVLYELFTGERFYHCSSIGERLSLGAATPLAGPALRDVDVTAQAAIRWCLEIDPADRPASAVDVAAMLLGGAAAARRIPSPELILATSGALTPTRALLMAAAALAATLFVAAQMDTLHRLNGALPYRTGALAARARTMLAMAEVPAPPLRDSEYWFQPDSRPIPPDPHAPRAVTFVYRQHASSLVPGNLLRLVTQNDPPPRQPGMTMVILDGSGRLLHFESEDLPARASEPLRAVEWASWFAAAGLSPADFTSGPDDRSVSTPHDRQSTWRRREPAGTGPVVTAASLNGRVVYFAAGDDGTIDADRTSVWTTHRGTFGEAFFTTLIIAVFVGAGVVGIGNLRRGRGHLQAANRIAAFVALAGIAAGLLRAHHVPSVVDEFQFVLGMSGWCLTWAAFCWVAYLALEPAIRRYAPHTLGAWTRLLAARFRDPAVGRDVLIGVWGGLIVVALATMRFRLHPMRNADLVLYPALESLRSAQRLVFVHLFGIADAVETGVAAACLLALARPLAPNIAVAACVLALLATPVTIGGFPLSVADALLAAAIMLVAVAVFLRAGLLALVTTYVVERLLVRVPITTVTSAWYFPASAVTLALVAALAVYGAIVTWLAIDRAHDA